MADAIYITNEDFERLRRLVDARLAGGPSHDSETLALLEQELDRAEIVNAREIPRDVVTMNSEVRLQDLASGEVKVYRIVFPTQVRSAGSISVLAPIGTALLGYRAGDTIEWRVPKGVRHLKILQVASRPKGVVETSG